MKRIYEVKFSLKHKGVSEWLNDETKVLANGDAQEAVDKVKKQALKDRGVRAFRLREVRILAEAS